MCVTNVNPSSSTYSFPSGVAAGESQSFSNRKVTIVGRSDWGPFTVPFPGIPLPWVRCNYEMR